MAERVSTERITEWLTTFPNGASPSQLRDALYDILDSRAALRESEAQVVTLCRALAMAKSMVLCGESMSPQAEAEIAAAFSGTAGRAILDELAGLLAEVERLKGGGRV